MTQCATDCASKARVTGSTLGTPHEHIRAAAHMHTSHDAKRRPCFVLPSPPLGGRFVCKAVRSPCGPLCGTLCVAGGALQVRGLVAGAFALGCFPFFLGPSWKRHTPRQPSETEASSLFHHLDLVTPHTGWRGPLRVPCAGQDHDGFPFRRPQPGTIIKGCYSLTGSQTLSQDEMGEKKGSSFSAAKVLWERHGRDEREGRDIA